MRGLIMGMTLASAGLYLLPANEAQAAICWVGRGAAKKIVPCNSREFLSSKDKHTDACLNKAAGIRVQVAPGNWRTCKGY